MAEPVRLNFKARRRPDLLLQFPEGDFLVSGNLMVDDFGDLAQAEQALWRLGDTDDDDSVALATAMRDAQDAINHLIRRSNPDAPSVIPMTVTEVLEIIAAIAGGPSATDVVTKALNSISVVDGDTPETDADTPELDAGGGAGGEAGDAAPLASSTRSRKSSSRSGSRRKEAGSGSAPTGGATSPGGSSRATAAQPVGA